MGDTLLTLRWALLLAVACAAWLFSTPVSATDLGVSGGVTPLRSKGRFSFVVENDLFSFGLGSGTDRFYSNGIYLNSDWSSPWLERAIKPKCDSPIAFGFMVAKNRSYFGLGLSHELHTPQTLNPCGEHFNNQEVTSESPLGRDPAVCVEKELDWAKNYAPRDRPFAAIGSIFFSAQVYYYRPTTIARGSQLLSQGRTWLRIDWGGYGSKAVFGYEVQKHFHGFINDILESDEGDLSSDPIGWKLSAERKSDVLLQAAVGVDLSLYRWTLDGLTDVGAEIEGSTQLKAGIPRNIFGLGTAVRVGLLPQHVRVRVAGPGDVQSVQAFVEASADGSLVATDETYGARGRYRPWQDEYAVGLSIGGLGVAASAHLRWQRMLFIDPLRGYPSTNKIVDDMHRYGRVAISFTY
jgi:hypothetical protein